MVGAMCVRVVLVLCVLTIDLSWATYDLDEKFGELDRKLDFIIAHFEDGTVAPPTTSASSGISSLDSWIIPLEVWRQPIGDNVKFTIRFKARSNGLVKWFDRTMTESDGRNATYITGSVEVQEVSHVTKPSQDVYDRVQAVFGYSKRSTSEADLNLELTNVNETEEMTSAITLPPFGIEPLGDLVYEEGKNMTIKLRIPSTGEDKPLLYDNIHCQVYLVDKENQVVTMHFQLSSDMYELLEIKNQTDATQLTVKINTAHYNTSALIGLTVEQVETSDTTLVHRVALYKQFVLLPSSQAGLLPDGFLGFLMEPNSQTENGITKTECSAGENCSIGCVAVGEDIVEFTISRVEPGGLRVPLETVSRDILYQQEYISTRSSRFPSKATGTERFECRVENSRGTVRVRTFDVTYFIPLDILEDQSEIRVLNENETSTIRRLAVVCTVKGSPVPNITFTIDRYSSYDYDLAPDELEIEGDIVTATKFVTYNTSDPYGWQGENSGKLLSAACSAEHSNDGNGPSWGYEYYQFIVPDDVEK